MRDEPRIHLLTLLPGDRFAIAGDDQAVFAVIAGSKPDSVVFLDDLGLTISAREIHALNGSFFVRVLPSEVRR